MKTKKAKNVGRPSLSGKPGITATRISLRLAPDERRRMEQQAAKTGYQTLSQWIRSVLKVALQKNK